MLKTKKMGRFYKLRKDLLVRLLREGPKFIKEIQREFLHLRMDGLRNLLDEIAEYGNDERYYLRSTYA